MKEISLIGSTGSIGRQVLSVVRRYPEKFKIVALVAGGNEKVFLEQVKEFRPRYCALVDRVKASQIRSEIPAGVDFACGEGRRSHRHHHSPRHGHRARGGALCGGQVAEI